MITTLFTARRRTRGSLTPRADRPRPHVRRSVLHVQRLRNAPSRRRTTRRARRARRVGSTRTRNRPPSESTETQRLLRLLLTIYTSVSPSLYPLPPILYMTLRRTTAIAPEAPPQHQQPQKQPRRTS
jgi:hypothetical protein